jgi:hypothetical protein
VKADADAEQTVGQALTGVGSGRGGVRRSLEGHEEGVPLGIDLDTPILPKHLA